MSMRSRLDRAHAIRAQKAVIRAENRQERRENRHASFSDYYAHEAVRNQARGSIADLRQPAVHWDPGQRVSRLIDAQVSRLEPRITTWDAVADREAG
jgi:hypothetical protein